MLVWEGAFRLALGAILGGIIGFERELHGRPAGFRTHLLVCLASTLIMIVSETYYLSASFDGALVRLDPARIAAGAITGVGFLGAGAIVKSGLSVHGVTTAACLWLVSAVGLAVGAGMYFAGIFSTLLGTMALVVLRIIERKSPKDIYRQVTLVADDRSDVEERVLLLLEEWRIQVVDLDYERDYLQKELSLCLVICLKSGTDLHGLLDQMGTYGFIKKVMVRSQRE